MGGMVLLLLAQSTLSEGPLRWFWPEKKGDRATVRKFSTGRPWFSNFSIVHIVRPAACIGSWVYWTYLLGLMKQTVLSRTATICCPKWREGTTICLLGKRQNLASAMQLNGSYGKEKSYVRNIFFWLWLLLFSKLRGLPRRFLRKCIYVSSLVY